MNYDSFLRPGRLFRSRSLLFLCVHRWLSKNFPSAGPAAAAASISAGVRLQNKLPVLRPKYSPVREPPKLRQGAGYQPYLVFSGQRFDLGRPCWQRGQRVLFVIATCFLLEFHLTPDRSSFDRLTLVRRSVGPEHRVSPCTRGVIPPSSRR